MATDPLKVLHISNAQSWRGGEQQIAYAVEELAELGVHQMMLVARNSSMHEFCQKRGIGHVSANKRFSVDPGIARKIDRTAREFGAHILHAHDAHAHTSCLLASLLYGCKTPLVLHRRVDFPVGQSALSRYKYNHHQLKKIVCVSRTIQEVLQPVMKNKNKLTVVHSGIDPQKFSKSPQNRLRQELGISPHVKLIGNSSALTGHKDYWTFLRTAQLINRQNPHTCFIIMGEGELHEQLVAHRDQLGLADAVVFTGFRDDIHELLPELDVLLFTSEMEGLGTTILDAYAAGVPVVATRAGGVQEMVEEKKSGLLADIKDAETLAYHVQSILEDSALRSQLVTNGYRKLQGFTKEQMAKHLLSVYEEMIP